MVRAFAVVVAVAVVVVDNKVMVALHTVVVVVAHSCWHPKACRIHGYLLVLPWFVDLILQRGDDVTMEGMSCLLMKTMVRH